MSATTPATASRREEIAHHWGRTITDSRNVFFSTATCTWNPMYLSAEFSRAHGHHDMVVNPMLALCVAVGLSVEDFSEAGGPFLGIEDCTFIEPVLPGDTLTATSVALDKCTSANRPGTGIVTWRTEARNQRDEVVMTFRCSNLFVFRGI